MCVPGLTEFNWVSIEFQHALDDFIGQDGWVTTIRAVRAAIEDPGAR